MIFLIMNLIRVKLIKYKNIDLIVCKKELLKGIPRWRLQMMNIEKLMNI